MIGAANINERRPIVERISERCMKCWDRSANALFFYHSHCSCFSEHEFVCSAIPSYNCALCLAWILRPPLFFLITSQFVLDYFFTPLLQLHPVPRHRWDTLWYGTVWHPLYNNEREVLTIPDRKRTTHSYYCLLTSYQLHVSVLY